MTCYFQLSARSGGTGRRAGLKIRWPQGRVGSTPSSGTIFLPRYILRISWNLLLSDASRKKGYWAELNRFNMACAVPDSVF